MIALESSRETKADTILTLEIERAIFEVCGFLKREKTDNKRFVFLVASCRRRRTRDISEEWEILYCGNEIEESWYRLCSLSQGFRKWFEERKRRGWFI